LGAACVALLVDYFRNKNQQLREAMVEMKVRQIEKERQLLSPATSLVATLPATKEVQPPAELVLAEPKSADKNATAKERPLVRSIDESPGTEISGEGIDFTSRRRRRRPAVEVAATGPEMKDDDMNSKKAFSDWLIQRAVARAARKMASEPTVAVEEPEAVAQTGEPAPAEPAALAAPSLEPEPSIESVDLTEPKHEDIVIEPPAVHGYESKHEPVVIDEFLWQSLFDNNSRSEKNSPKPASIVIAAPEPEPVDEAPVLPDPPPVRSNQGFQIVPKSPAAVELLNVPAGFHDSVVLEGLKTSPVPFSGLVISVGITQNDPRSSEELAQTVTAYIRTLLRESDFACRTGEDEFLLVCPNLSGVAAHRHLSAISERLWDFQLRALGSFLMLFSLGGVDIQREPLAEAIASATERMSQTKRSRKAIVTLMPGQRRRKAV
jgi:hypothetical protein